MGKGDLIDFAAKMTPVVLAEIMIFLNYFLIAACLGSVYALWAYLPVTGPLVLAAQSLGTGIAFAAVLYIAFQVLFLKADLAAYRVTLARIRCPHNDLNKHDDDYESNDDENDGCDCDRCNRPAPSCGNRLCAILSRNLSSADRLELMGEALSAMAANEDRLRAELQRERSQAQTYQQAYNNLVRTPLNMAQAPFNMAQASINNNMGQHPYYNYVVQQPRTQQPQPAMPQYRPQQPMPQQQSVNPMMSQQPRPRPMAQSTHPVVQPAFPAPERATQQVRSAEPPVQPPVTVEKPAESEQTEQTEKTTETANTEKTEKTAEPEQAPKPAEPKQTESVSDTDDEEWTKKEPKQPEQREQREQPEQTPTAEKTD